MSDLAERLDRHNTSVDLQLATVGRCGMLHLASGRRCALPAGHSGGCQFDFLDRRGRVRPYLPGPRRPH